jgi:hypothetical protein
MWLGKSARRFFLLRSGLWKSGLWHWHWHCARWKWWVWVCGIIDSDSDVIGVFDVDVSRLRRDALKY